ncbi:hypothetical protein VPH35_100711 [Triticum aestivum]|nr:UDP-glycosyltransferase 91B1-like [Triticum aestivum]
MEEAGGRLEVVMFPWLAFGHMLPYLDLSTRLAARGHAVAFVSTPRNLARLPPVPPHLSGRLRRRRAQGTLRNIPDRPGLLAGVAAFMGPRGANTAHPRTTLEDFIVAPAWYPFPSTVAYRRYEAEWLAGSFRPSASGVPHMHRMWQINERCRLTIYRSCDEVEPGVLALLSNLYQKPSIAAGVLLPPPDIGVANRGVRPDMFRWLDDHPPKSVIYVALGSEAPVTLKNLHELALGLELAGVRFLWALRSPGAPSDSGTGVDDHGVLPDGFEERTRGRSMVETGWVPQVKALAHGAVAAFLTHCGWGSTVESFAFGHPLVMLPFVLDQPLVARTMTEKGVGVEVARDEGDGSFDRDGVAAAVRRVMVDDEGKVLASNAKKLHEVLADQERQEWYIDDVVKHLRCYKDA